MEFNNIRKLSVFQKMDRVRRFELGAQRAHQAGRIVIPIYLGVGQESIASTLSEVLPKGIPIFAQHRSHSYFLSFGGNAKLLRAELLSEDTFSSKGALGSASIASKEIRMYGHSGFMGDQVPIAVGFAMVKKEITLAVVGDASAEEDYVLGALGYAATKSIPLLMVCEDNNLSILTPKEIRRKWNICDVARSFGCLAVDISDDPEEIWNAVSNWDRSNCLVLNVRTERHLWHAGSGRDRQPNIDRLSLFHNLLCSAGMSMEVENIERENELEVNKLWN